MLIKNNQDPEKVWFLCAKCGTPMRPGTGKCKCGAIEMTRQGKEGPVMILGDNPDDLVVDNDR